MEPMDQAVGEDLRKSKRLFLNLPVKVTRQPPGQSEESFFISSLTQLSSDGAFLSTSAQYATGTMIALDFELPSSSSQIKPVHALGKIAWQISGKNQEAAVPPIYNPVLGMGIHFVMMTQKEKELIQAFVTHKDENIPKKKKGPPPTRRLLSSLRKKPKH